MADILGMMDYIGRRADQGVQTGKQNRLAGLYQQALQGPRDQRSSLIAQMAGVSPQAAFDAEKHFGGMDDNARQRLGQYAAAFDALPDDQKPTAYPQLAKQAQELGIPAPAEWNPAYAPNIQQLAQSLGGMGNNATPTGFRELHMKALAAGYKPGTPEYQSAMRVGIGTEGRAATGGFGFEKVVGADGRERMGRTNPRTGVFEVYDEASGNFTPLGGPAALNGGPAPAAAGFDDGGGAVVGGTRVNMGLPPQVQESVAKGIAAMEAAGVERSVIDAFATSQMSQSADRPGAASRPSNPALGVSQAPAEKAFATESGQQAAQIATLGQRGEIEARNAAAKALAEEGARALAAQQFGTKESREAAVEARKKLPQLNNAVRGITRIEQALEKVNKGMLGDTGPVDQFFQRYTKEGQELEAAVGAIQNSILALTRVPGVGSQSDLEQRVAMLQYPSLDKAPEVNARTIQNLRLFMQDLQSAYQQVTGGQQSEPSSGGGWSIKRIGD